jgi:hypothetical protein
MTEIGAEVYGDDVQFTEEPETISVRDLRKGDFVVTFPRQCGIRGFRANSGIREISAPHFARWRSGRVAVQSRTVRFISDIEPIDVPCYCTIVVRRRITTPA